jgi:hypothetical protein
MPVDRLFHPRAGHSAKVSGLHHLAFRVWWTYQLAADDYGVMQESAAVVQASNDALQKVATKVIDEILAELVRVGLLVRFEHQHNRYLCQLDWQDFQKVRWPRDTSQPLPPAEILGKCSPSTQQLFAQHPRCSRSTSGDLPGDFPCARARETATATAHPLTTAMASGSEEREHEREKPNGAIAGFNAFWAAYPRKSQRDEALRVWSTLHPDAALIERIVRAVHEQRTWPAWMREGGRFIPNPAKWLAAQRWTDEPPELVAETVSAVTRQNRANAEETKRLMRERHGRR